MAKKGILNKLFGTRSERELKKIMPIADKVDALEEQWRTLTDDELKAKTGEFKTRLANGETLDDILPEAFATVREAADRVIGLRPYRVQIIGGIVLHQGRIAEMKTGEGKTLVATLPAYLNALTGNGVHIVTVNDYLARRDSEWIGKVHRFLGLTVGLIVHGLDNAERKAAYAADITYGTNNEMGFDFLRDNMAIYKARMVQRGHAFAIVDEVDSILIDEARTPLIISGQGDKSTELYEKVDQFVARLRKVVFATTDEKQLLGSEVDADYIVDEKSRSATLTDSGVAKAEAYFGLENLSDLENSTLSHHINQALKARGIMKRDVDYVIKDEQVVIVDEFTGRLMFGRRYSEGLHQAIEAKEGVSVEKESKTLATITFQNYFRLYSKLSGMTGTALTEEEEFDSIYNLDIVEIPTNRPLMRIDHSDVVYKNDIGKNNAIIAKIAECHAKGQPVLVGTVSVEKSEYLASLLKKRGIKHNVLNAKNHEREAEIVAQAGKLGAVTISTNMAGRGTDIMLGGNPEFLAKSDMRKAGIPDEIIAEASGFAETDNQEILDAREMYSRLIEEHKAVTSVEAEKVREAGGLFILGTERHESRRIDNQLRGRAGRQGDPGESKFYIAMTDDIMRLFGSERIMGMMDTLGIEDDMPIDQKMLSNAIENAQTRVESQHFQSRKNVLEYDDVMNQQRELIYEQRRKVLNGEDVKSYIQSMIFDVIQRDVTSVLGAGQTVQNQEQLDEILKPFIGVFLLPGMYKLENMTKTTSEQLIESLKNVAIGVYENKEESLGNIPDTDTPLMRELERVILLRVVDEFWMDHIDAMHDLRQGIGLRAYGNIKPVDAYKQEGFDMFEAMINGIKDETTRRVFTARVKTQENLERKSVAQANAVQNVGGPAVKQPKRAVKKPGRNDPCPCGKTRPNGLPMKYKNCCGRTGNEN